MHLKSMKDRKQGELYLELKQYYRIDPIFKSGC
jgi:hypothetical protein